MDKQSLILIALELDYLDILNFCNTNKFVNDTVCKNKFFWVNKLKKDFNFNFNEKHFVAGQDPKEYYFILSNITIRKNKKINVSFDKIISRLINENKRDLALYLAETEKEIFQNKDINRLSKSLEAAAAKNDDELVDLIFKYRGGTAKVAARGYARAGNKERMEYFMSKTPPRFINYTELKKAAEEGGHPELFP